MLCAAGILGTAMVAVAGAIEASARRVREARDAVVAGRLASAKLEEALVLRSAADAADSGEHPGREDMRWRVVVDEGAFQLGELELGEDWALVTVEVTWRGGDRRTVQSSRRPKLRDDGAP